MTGGFRFDYGALSHEGRVRTNNEDAFCARPLEGLYAVADGMGGHENGEWASAKIVEHLNAVVLPEDFDAAWTVLGEALHSANADIWNEAESRGLQMGSTVVVLFVRGTRFAILWVGDSRAYLSRDGMLVQLSHDHTQVQEMLDRGLLTAEEAEDHPMSHVLARAMGVRDTVEVDVISDEIAPGDVFLLCSDGLMARVEDSEIAGLLGEHDPDLRVKKLVDLTLERGAPDNVTVVTVSAQQPTAPVLAHPLHTVAP
jgi:serine/threonine protein phosphatase Stp1